MKFKLKGNESVRYGVTFKVNVKGNIVRKKLHFMGGVEYDSTEIDVPMPIDGEIQKIPIDEDQIIDFLRQNDTIVEYIQEKGKAKSNEKGDTHGKKEPKSEAKE